MNAKSVVTQGKPYWRLDTTFICIILKIAITEY